MASVASQSIEKVSRMRERYAQTVLTFRMTYVLVHNVLYVTERERKINGPKKCYFRVYATDTDHNRLALVGKVGKKALVFPYCIV